MDEPLVLPPIKKYPDYSVSFVNPSDSPPPFALAERVPVASARRLTGSAMCTQINSLFKCGHRAFNKFDNCPEFVHYFSSLSLAPSRPRPPTSIISHPRPGPSYTVRKSTSFKDPPADQSTRASHVSEREASTRTWWSIECARTVSCESPRATRPPPARLTVTARAQARRTRGGMVTRGESTGRSEVVVEAKVCNVTVSVSVFKHKRGR